MAERMTNTLVELRQRFMKDIAQAKLTVESDADMSELLELENFIIEKNRAPIAAMEAQGLVPGGAGPGGPMQGGGMPGIGQGVNVDELRRMLGQPGSNFAGMAPA